MHSYLPALAVRTKMAAAISINGAMVGDTSEASSVIVPLSDSGEYYVGVYPLQNGRDLLYPVMRKLCFRQGVLQALQSDDVEAYIWPDGLVEAVFSPGLLQRKTAHPFPYTIEKKTLQDGCDAMLYYENGLRLAIEKEGRILYGALLGQATEGWMLERENMLLIGAGKGALPEEDLPEHFAGMIVALGEEYRELLRVRGDAVGYESGGIVSFMRLPTLLQHDKKQKYTYRAGAFFEEDPETGFFTHAPKEPITPMDILRAFCEAVLYGLFQEAYTYLTPALREGLDESTLRACLGEFTGIRQTPMKRRGYALGLLYERKEGIVPVRVFSFAFDGNLIDNIAEEE